MSRLLKFYRGEGTDSRGRTLADLWCYPDEQLESVHDFIQWMFPLREPSQFNPVAPLLSSDDIAAFGSESALRAKLRRSFEVFLAFLGLRYCDGEVVLAADFREKGDVWRYPNHNWLRISRVLASTRILGLVEESGAFFRFLSSLKDGGLTSIDDETFRHWTAAFGEA